MVLPFLLVSALLLRTAPSPQALAFQLPPYLAESDTVHALAGLSEPQLKSLRSGSITPIQARALVRGPFCRRAPRRETDKFAQIANHLRSGLCWSLERIASARPLSTHRFPEDALQWPSVPDWVALLGPEKPAGARLEVKAEGKALSISQLDPEADFLNGNRVTHRLLSRGDFTGDGKEDLLLWTESDSLSGNFADCSVLLVDLGPPPRRALRLRAERKLGRCS